MAFGDRVQHPPGVFPEDFTNLTGLGSPGGIWSDGITMWVISPVNLQAYNLATKAREDTKDIPLSAADGNKNPKDMWSDGTTIWVGNRTPASKIFAYTLATKARDPDKDFTLTPISGGIFFVDGIWSDGTTMFAIDGRTPNGTLRAYNLITKAREQAKEFGLGNAVFYGLWSDGITLWAGVLQKRILAFNLSARIPDTDKNFNALAGIGQSYGLWSNGLTMWVENISASSGRGIFAYVLVSEAPNVPTGLTLAPITNTLDVSWVAPIEVDADPAAKPPVVGYGPVDTYDIRHRAIGAPDWITRTGITLTATDITSLVFGGQYEVQVRAVNLRGFSPWSASAVATTSPFPPPSTLFSLFTLGIDRAGAFTNEAFNMIQLFAKWGRSEASYLARAQPVQMQVILDNESGRYDPGMILPRARINLDHLGATVAHAYVRSVRPQIDHSTGLRQTVIHAEGALALFNNDAHELSLFITDTVRTGSVIHEILDQTGWAPGARDIDAGQVRLQPAHYTEILAPRALGKAGPALRATETAEIGLLHERRGDFIVFEERFHRELDDSPPGFTFGSLGGTNFISPLGVTNPEDSWDNLYTVIRIGASRAVVQTDKRVYTWRKDTIDTDPLVIRAGVTVQFGIDMVIEPQNLEDDNVKSVAQWTTVDSEFQNAAGVVVTTDVALTFLNDGRTRRRVNIANANAFDVNLTKLELSGRGVALYGDLTIPYLEDAAAVALYDTRILDLETSFIGDGLNEGGDGIAEGNATAQLLLTRYAHPQPHGRQAFDPLESANNLAAMHTMEISQPVNMLLGTGFQAGIYHVEGGDIQLDVGREWAEMGVNLSRRGLRFIDRDQAVNVTPSSDAWGVNVTTPFTLLIGQPYVIATEVTFPSGSVISGSDDPVMRVLLNGQPYSVWSESDIPINDPQFRAALVIGGAAASVVLVQVRLRQAGSIAITASHVRYVRIDS